jgi:thiol-disulfide isomerase/thioredoxin
MLGALQRFLQRCGGVLIRPQATLAELAPGEGRRDAWVLAGLWLLGSQVERLTEAAARFEALGSVLLLVNVLALALLTPLLVGLVVEGIVGVARSRYRQLPLVALVAVATIGNLLRQQGVELPGPRYLPEMLGAAWAVGLAVWIRKRMPAAEHEPEDQSGDRPGHRRGVVKMLLGGLVVALALLAGGRDLGVGIRHWDDYNPIRLNEPVPAFETQLADGRTLTAASLEGRVSLFAFWATWCHACTLEMPTLVALDRHYAGADFDLYGVNRDDGRPRERAAAVAAYIAEHQIEFAQIYDDNRMARAFGVDVLPTLVIVDKHGLIQHVHLGQVSERRLRREIDALLTD